MVGAKGFEPSTLCTPCKCATRLRHAPTREGEYIISRTKMQPPFLQNYIDVRLFL